MKAIMSVALALPISVAAVDVNLSFEFYKNVENNELVNNFNLESGWATLSEPSGFSGRRITVVAAPADLRFLQPLGLKKGSTVEVGIDFEVVDPIPKTGMVQPCILKIETTSDSVQADVTRETTGSPFQVRIFLPYGKTSNVSLAKLSQWNRLTLRCELVGGATEFDVHTTASVKSLQDNTIVATQSSTSEIPGFFKSNSASAYVRAHDAVSLDNFACSAPDPESLVVEAFPAIQLQWRSIPGRRYFVDRRTQLEKPEWSPLAGPFLGTGSTMHFFASTRAYPASFYRVREE